MEIFKHMCSQRGVSSIWCPKYRRKILIGTIAKDLRELLKLKAKELDIEIDDMKVMPDHVRLFVNANPTAAHH